MYLPAEVLDNILPLSIVLTMSYLRVQAMILVLPGLSERFMFARTRIAVAIALTPVAYAVSPSATSAASFAAEIQRDGVAGLAFTAVREMLAGLLTALPVRLFAMSLHVAASALAAAASLSQLIGTGTEAAPHPIGNFLHLGGLALLMTMGLPLLLADLIAQSYLLFPPGVTVFGPDWVEKMIAIVGQSFVLALALASPFILGGLLYQLLGGIVNRVMPSLPVVFIGAPAIILLALAGLAILAPAILSGWAEAVMQAHWP